MMKDTVSKIRYVTVGRPQGTPVIVAVSQACLPQAGTACNCRYVFWPVDVGCGRILQGLLMATVLCLTGCLDPLSGAKPVVPGKETVEQAIAALEAQADDVGSLQLYGDCKLGYVDEDGKRREHNVSYKLWLDPPYNIVLQGRVVLGHRGLIHMGSNAEEFWLAIQPDINTYWWGRWADVQGSLPLPLSPRIFLEALGRVTFDSPRHWTLTHESGVDILTKTDPSGKQVKQLTVSTSDYRPRKIMYFDDDGKVLIVVDLGFYEHHGGMRLPTEIQIVGYTDGEATDSIKLHVVQGRDSTFRQGQFDRREPQGYDKVWRYTPEGFVAGQ